MPKIGRKKIALLFAGGTVMSPRPAAWEIVRRPEHITRWMNHMDELHVVADIEPIFVTGKPSADIGGDEWLQLAQTVRRVIHRVDGVVILHGIETLHYTANALSLMMRSLPVPVILSGSPLHSSSEPQVEFGARASMINAVQVATADIADVVVVFGNRIMKASRVHLVKQHNFTQLMTVDGTLLGRFDFGTKLFPGRILRAPRQPQWSIHLDQRLLVTTFSPGTLPGIIRRAIGDTVHAVLVQSSELHFSPGQEMVNELRQAVARGIPVIITGHVGSAIPESEFIVLRHISRSMAMVKVMWALGAKRDIAGLRKLLLKNVAGEIVTVTSP